MRNAAIFLPIVFTLIFFSSPVFAASGHFGWETLAQARQRTRDRSEFPIYQYGTMGVRNLPANFTFDTDFRAFIDPATEEESLDLYQAAFSVEPIDNLLVVSGGRQFSDDGFDVVLRDGLTIDVTPEGYLGFTVYGGIPRYNEEGGFNNVTEGLMTGGIARLQNIEGVTAQLALRYRKIDITRNDFRANDTLYMGLTDSFEFGDMAWSPTLYTNLEYDAGGQVVDIGSVGVEFFPHWRLSGSVEGSYFNVSRNSNDTTIFESYYDDEIWQAREGMRFRLIKDLSLFESLYFQRGSIINVGYKNSYIAEGGLDYYLKVIKMSIIPQYYFRRSAGGTVHGGYLETGVKELFNPSLEADIGVDLSRYSKITNEESTALSVVGSVGYKFWKYCVASIGGEFNRNQDFKREARVTFLLDIYFDGSLDYHPKNRMTSMGLFN